MEHTLLDKLVEGGQLKSYAHRTESDWDWSSEYLDLVFPNGERVTIAPENNRRLSVY